MRIYSLLNETNVTIIIEDNGIGMRPERFQQVKKLINCPQSMENTKVGMRNVQQRLKLFYGDLYGINIEGESRRGTRVSIFLPIMNEEGKM